jgi:hypothetical protein
MRRYVEVYIQYRIIFNIIYIYTHTHTCICTYMRREIQRYVEVFFDDGELCRTCRVRGS